ncbi:hypothetical protein MJG53_001088 [Ovis ammon polii x Ovis aries]|uniref:Uncharacterized protein n=1 Tax=Ovis ammon polii x Ovis aries TaxID=2918886 RepID=A0ACB9VJY3_9CETA|nr:hypothetical protein MJT46_000586 [Ovis ammon polii x Ovis aries]KAI4590039.1 hypothetical protein MJG53_001088 [Ovis ammon polii x Ovis aries]
MALKKLKQCSIKVDPVAITHDGNYTCQIATSNGNFQHEYHLQVLVPPKVTLTQTEKGTAVCKAAAGKPAAQISWTPEGDCATEQEPYWGNGTVTVQSTCHWEDRHVLNVSCSVSHLTGNKSLSIQLSQGSEIQAHFILYIIAPIFIILIVAGSIWLLKISGCRKCKLKKTEHTPVVEEIDPVAITHDGNYTCQIATSNGNFQHEYHLQVLVPPEVTLVQTEKGTAVCKAAVGKPAAQISWTPEGDCATEQEPYWGNGTVTVQSTCRWGGRHVLNVSCSVSHLTGNKSLSIELDKGQDLEDLLTPCRGAELGADRLLRGLFPEILRARLLLVPKDPWLDAEQYVICFMAEAGESNSTSSNHELNVLSMLISKNSSLTGDKNSDYRSEVHQAVRSFADT